MFEQKMKLKWESPVRMIHLFNFLFSRNYLYPWNTIRCLWICKKVVLGIDFVVIFLVILTRILTIKVARDHCKNLENLNLANLTGCWLNLSQKFKRTFLISCHILCDFSMVLFNEEESRERWKDMAKLCFTLRVLVVVL